MKKKLEINWTQLVLAAEDTAGLQLSSLQKTLPCPPQPFPFWNLQTALMDRTCTLR